MGCGCKSPVNDRGRQRSCAVMCMVCPERRDQVCTVNELPTRRIVELRIACPMDHHPNGAGVLVWLGVKWYGVPAPIRWAWPVLRRLNRWPDLSGSLPWCGCVKTIKDWWTR